ncbi:choice-of-anchor I family protein [Polaribacter sp.]|nr:choice-of-anchor I family protein [Polaribacter sp.]
MKKITLLFTLLITSITFSQVDLVITEIFSGQVGADLTADWFEIHNKGNVAWALATDGSLYYDDESADDSTADIILGITDIQPDERVIVLISEDFATDLINFKSTWNPVVDLTNIKVGYTDGAGLGGGGDTVNIWIGDPTQSSPVAIASYPDTANDDGKSYDIELSAFSEVANINFAVATTALGGEVSNVPNIASLGNVQPVLKIEVTEIFPGQEGADVTADWFEVYNSGFATYTANTEGVLYYDDDSADDSDATIIEGISSLQPKERAIVVVGNQSDADEFFTVWGSIVNLDNVKIGYTDGSGLGGGGDAVNLWMGDPTQSTVIASASYPDTTADDGKSYDVELSTFSEIGNTSNAVATIALGGDDSDVPNIASPANALVATLPTVTFNEAYTSVQENGTSVSFTINTSKALFSEATVDVVLQTGGSAVEGTDFTYSTTQTVMFTTGSTDSQTITIPIIDNADDNSDVFFVVKLENASGVTIGDTEMFSVYILDDDTVVPAENSDILNANYLTSYLVDADGTAEITAYDATTQRLFVTNSTSIEVLDFSDPSNISSISSISLPENTDGVQSVAVSNGLLAAAAAADPSTDSGLIMFADTDGNNSITVTVGALPDMITFTPDGTKLLVANEGEPNSDYTIDPEGSVSIIDVSGGLAEISQSNVTTLNFNAFDSDLSALLANNIRIFGPNASVSQDLEPEYITISEDSNTAYVAMQENNAYAVVDLSTLSITNIFPFGLKDHSLMQNSLDTSNDTDFVFDSSWPVYGMYMPDAISYFKVNGTGYIATANEGDARDYNGYSEERNLGDSDYVLDPTVFSNAAILALEANLGAINITAASGNTDSDSEYEEIHVYGGRSFSIFEANSGNIIFDSGNDFEVITTADTSYGAIFNASNTNNTFKNRSDDKGPEPEGILVQEIDGKFYAFILLERIGGVMIYDVTDPTAPVFLQYLNSRDATPSADESGDLGPEGIVYVSENDSPNGTALLIVSNEVSATLSIYSLDNITLSADTFTKGTATFSLFPNPAKDRVELSKVDDYNVFDVSGRNIKQIKNDNKILVSDFDSGIYFITNSLGVKRKLIVK